MEAGTYIIKWSAPAHNANQHKTQLVYADNSGFTSNPILIQGSSEYDASAMDPNTQTRSFGETIVTIPGKKFFKIQHRCSVTQNSTGLGVYSNFGVNEIYTQVSLMKL